MSTARHELRDDMDKQPEQLQREADDVRVDMEHTVDELANLFSPGMLINYAMGLFRSEGDGGFVRNLSTQIQNNPVPAILTGVGLTWLMTASKQPPVQGARSGTSHAGSSHAMQSAGDKLSSAADRARTSTRNLTESASDVKQRLSDGSHQMMDSARTGARSVRSHYDNMLQEQPLVLGAIAIAAGAALGALMPRTEAEDRTMGKVSDEQKETVKQRAGELQEQAETKVEDKLEEQRSHAESSQHGTAGSSQSVSSEDGTGSSASTSFSPPFSDDQRRDTSSPKAQPRGESPASRESNAPAGARGPAGSGPSAGRSEEGVPPANPSAVPNHPDANPPTLNYREDGQR